MGMNTYFCRKFWILDIKIGQQPAAPTDFDHVLKCARHWEISPYFFQAAGALKLSFWR